MSTSKTGIVRLQWKISKAVKLILKIAVTAFCLWYVSTKINFGAAVSVLTRSNWGWIAAALGLFVMSKLIAAYRLNLYFKTISVHLAAKENLQLYWLGMFFNLFLPGAISGDGYKVILLHKRFGTPYKKLSAAVLLDRFSGVTALAIIFSIYCSFILANVAWVTVLCAGAIASVWVLFIITKVWFRDFLSAYWATFALGLVVQLSQVLAIYCLINAIGLSTASHEWILIFLASAIITVLPVSLGGGLGTRELVFAEGAKYFRLDPQTGVVISLLFYLITLVGSIWGLVYVFGKRKEKGQEIELES